VWLSANDRFGHASAERFFHGSLGTRAVLRERDALATVPLVADPSALSKLAGH
jgi:hypothetical protein